MHGIVGRVRARTGPPSWRTALITAAFAVAYIGIAAAQFASAAATTMAELYEAAKREGTLVVIGPPSVDVRTRLSEDFSKAYPGVTLSYSGLRAGQIAAKLRAEAKAGIFSTDAVITATVLASLILRKSGLFQPIPPLLIDADAKDGSKWRDGALAYADAAKTNIAVVSIVTPMVLINTDLVKPGELASDTDVLNPKWRGKFVTGSPFIPSVTSTDAHRLLDLHGEEYLRKLAAQKPVLTKNYRQAVDWVAKGRYPFAIGISPATVTQFLKRGVGNIRMIGARDWADPLQVSPGFGSLAVAAKPANPNAAQLFANWLLTKEGMTSLARGMGYPGMRTDVPVEHVPEALRFVDGKSYVKSYLQDYLLHPNGKKAVKLLKELRYGE